MGPLLIRCVANDLYLNVNGVGHLRATTRKSDASEFYLKSSGNPKCPEEFYICYFGSKHAKHDQHSDIEDAKQVPQYLQTPINIFGSNPGPLEFGYHIRDKDTRLLLQSSVRKHNQPPVSLSAWMSGSETCFIQCARRRKKGYLAVKQSEYSTYTCCVPSKHDSDASTLFQIVQKWEARVDNLMTVREPLHEGATYLSMAIQTACRGMQLRKLPTAQLAEGSDSESEEYENVSEDVPRDHESKEYRTIPKEYKEDELS